MGMTRASHGTLPSDLSAQEIDRRYRVALADIRRGGTGDIARHVPRMARKASITSRMVLVVLARGHATVPAIANSIGCAASQAWGHISFLRKQDKVEVKAWLERRDDTQGKRRRMAVYGLKADRPTPN